MESRLVRVEERLEYLRERQEEHMKRSDAYKEETKQDLKATRKMMEQLSNDFRASENQKRGAYWALTAGLGMIGAVGGYMLKPFGK